MPLATIPFLPSSSSSSSSKSSLLSAFKKSPKNFQMSYTISTPRSANAKFIEKDLPTVIYLHPVYLSQASFHGPFPSSSSPASLSLHKADVLLFFAVSLQPSSQTLT